MIISEKLGIWNFQNHPWLPFIISLLCFGSGDSPATHSCDWSRTDRTRSRPRECGIPLEIWPGYQTSIRRHEAQVLLNVEICHKVLSRDTALDEILGCRNQMGPRIKSKAKSQGEKRRGYLPLYRRRVIEEDNNTKNKIKKNREEINKGESEK